MHEFTIALNIIDIAKSEAEKAHVSEISQIEIEIGQASGVVREALEFALESAVKNSVLEKASVVIIEIGSIAECNVCKHKFETDSLIGICPQCGEITTNLISGRELKVKSITL